MRKRAPLALPLRSVPDQVAHEQALCPQCGLARKHQVVVLGRIGLRLVFRCTRCKARFFRVDRRLPHPPDEWDDSQDALLGADPHEEMSE